MSRRIEQGQATRQELLAVAQKLFATNGYEATSIEQVLTASEVSRGALYHHFASKEALFEALPGGVGGAMGAAGVRAAGRAREGVGGLGAGGGAWVGFAGAPGAQQIAVIAAPAVVGWERWRAIDARHGFGLLKGALA